MRTRTLRRGPEREREDLGGRYECPGRRRRRRQRRSIIFIAAGEVLP